jgi:uncharacterized FlaG/YvyC family protein
MEANRKTDREQTKQKIKADWENLKEMMEEMKEEIKSCQVEI